MAVVVEILPKDLYALGNLEKLADRLGISVRNIAVHESRLAAWDCMMSTPPLWTGKKNRPGAAMRIGKNAIARDVSMLFPDLTDKKRYVFWKRKDGGVGWRLVGSKKAHAVRADRVDDSGAKMAAHHERNRNPRNGYVYRGDKMFITTRGVQKAYIKKVWEKIGIHAAGWLPAYLRFARFDKIVSGQGVADNKVVPDWVMRHGPRNGSAVDAMSPHGHGYLMGQQVWRFGYASKLKSQMASIMRTRERDMNKWLAIRLSKHVKDANTGMIRYGG